MLGTSLVEVCTIGKTTACTFRLGRGKSPFRVSASPCGPTLAWASTARRSTPTSTTGSGSWRATCTSSSQRPGVGILPASWPTTHLAHRDLPDERVRAHVRRRRDPTCLPPHADLTKHETVEVFRALVHCRTADPDRGRHQHGAVPRVRGNRVRDGHSPAGQRAKSRRAALYNSSVPRGRDSRWPRSLRTSSTTLPIAVRSTSSRTAIEISHKG